MMAMFYVEQGRSVYGWYAGSCGGEYPMRFFALEDFYSAGGGAFYRSREDDVYGPWVRVVDKGDTDGEVPIDPPAPVPEPLPHELERLQDAFAREWLVLDEARPPALRAARLGRLRKGDPVWTVSSQGCDARVLGYLKRHAGLDYA